MRTFHLVNVVEEELNRLDKNDIKIDFRAQGETSILGDENLIRLFLLEFFSHVIESAQYAVTVALTKKNNFVELFIQDDRRDLNEQKTELLYHKIGNVMNHHEGTFSVAQKNGLEITLRFPHSNDRVFTK